MATGLGRTFVLALSTLISCPRIVERVVESVLTTAQMLTPTVQAGNRRATVAGNMQNTWQQTVKRVATNVN